VVSLDRRCSDDRHIAFQDMVGCSAQELEQRHERFKASRRPSGGKPRTFPDPGKAVATLTYVGPDKIERTVVASPSSMDAGFYDWNEGGAAKIQVCKANPAVWRTSPLDPARC
jgi:hypothetical protein